MKRAKDPLDFYRSTITEEFIEELLRAQSVVHRDGIFKASVVIWLMIAQRLKPNRSLSHALEELKTGGAEFLQERGSGSIRVRGERISNSTGGLAQARERTPEELVEQVADRLAKALEDLSKESEKQRLYVLDGSTVCVSHTKKNIESYPPHKNQYGAAHFPLVRIGIATNVSSGVAVRPALRAYEGENACSELDLADDLLTRLPPNSIALGDRYYGCFRFAFAARQNGHEVICRMKELNSKRFIGSPKTQCGEKQVEWQPSPRERAKYPKLPVDAVVRGKMVWINVGQPGFQPTKLVLFTTLTLPPKKIAELYALRWNVELDLRHMKTTLDLAFVNAKSPQMVQKEIILAIAAYNLIHHTMCTAARALKLDPRQISFTRALQRIESLLHISFRDDPQEKKQRAFERALLDVKSLLLYKRKTRRLTEPRKIWQSGKKNFFATSSSRIEERRLINPTIRQSKISNHKHLALN